MNQHALPPQPDPGLPHWKQLLRRFPVVATALLLCLLAALWTRLGASLEAMAFMTFTPLLFDGQAVYMVPLEYGLQEGQWWRLLTPVFIHFGFLHLAMNMLWLWELGRRIEFYHGSIFVLLLALVSAVLSNLAQYWFSGPSLFGGMSGVLYALLGFCWIFHRIRPVAAYQLPKGVIGMMLIWLLLCLSGLVTALGFGQIANAAHVSGLLAGCVAGAVAAILSRLKNSDISID